MEMQDWFKENPPHTWRTLWEAQLRESGKQEACLVCNSYKVRHMCTFIPCDSQQFGAKVGKERVILYGLCRECIKKDDKTLDELVEQMLLSKIKKGNHGF